MRKEIKKQYDQLLKSGDLEELLTNSSGEWEKDQEQFTILFLQSQELIEQFECNSKITFDTYSLLEDVEQDYEE